MLLALALRLAVPSPAAYARARLGLTAAEAVLGGRLGRAFGLRLNDACTEVAGGFPLHAAREHPAASAGSGSSSSTGGTSV